MHLHIKQTHPALKDSIPLIKHYHQQNAQRDYVDNQPNTSQTEPWNDKTKGTHTHEEKQMRREQSTDNLKYKVTPSSPCYFLHQRKGPLQ